MALKELVKGITKKGHMKVKVMHSHLATEVITIVISL